MFIDYLMHRSLEEATKFDDKKIGLLIVLINATFINMITVYGRFDLRTVTQLMKFQMISIDNILDFLMKFYGN